MRVACVATKGFEDHELADPVEALRDAGHQVDVIAPHEDEIAGYHGEVKVTPQLAIDDASPEEYDALFVPGGYSPDQLRADNRFIRFVRAFEEKPIFAICHGPQLLFTAGLLDEKRVTAWRTVQFDLESAGLDVVDEAVVEDGLLITSRQPSDLPQFCQAIVRCLSHLPEPEASEPSIGTEEREGEELR